MERWQCVELSRGDEKDAMRLASTAATAAAMSVAERLGGDGAPALELLVSCVVRMVMAS